MRNLILKGKNGHGELEFSHKTALEAISKVEHVSLVTAEGNGRTTIVILSKENAQEIVDFLCVVFNINSSH